MLMLAFLFAGFDDEFRSAYAKADRRRFVGNVFRRGFGDFSGDHRQRAAFERCIDGTGMGRAVEGKAIDHQRRIGSGRKQGVVTQGDADGTVGCGQDTVIDHDFAAWLGLTPKAHSSGGKDRLGRISKQGNENLRRLLVMGAATVVRHTRKGETRRKSRLTDWVSGLVLKNKPFKLIAVALANKMARIIWALIKRNETYAPQRA